MEGFDYHESEALSGVCVEALRALVSRDAEGWMGRGMLVVFVGVPVLGGICGSQQASLVSEHHFLKLRFRAFPLPSSRICSFDSDIVCVRFLLLGKRT